ncbi:hypothetical protein [Sorangium sp. So ce388]|uniref:hypothetical protein n=1 Tax=Sorangium sp. So ce388 TaxID=3133309 RepID=UPI003F5BEAAA
MAIMNRRIIKARSSSGCACGCAEPPPRSSGVATLARRAGRHLPLLPAIALLVLPKCPLCVAAYLGILGSLGASAFLRDAWGLPLGAGLLAFALGALLLRALASQDYRPVLAGLAGASALLVGKFVLDAPPLLSSTLLGAGALLLLGASLWSVRRAARRTGPSPSRGRTAKGAQGSSLPSSP